MAADPAPKTIAPSLAAWIVGGLAIALLLARLAVLVQTRWSPFLVFPLVFGGLLGVGLLIIAQLFALPRSWALAAAATSGLLFAASLHYFAYREFLQVDEAARLKNPQAALFIEPKSFQDFLHYSARERNIGPWQVHGTLVWLTWVLDGLLAIAAAVAVVFLGQRRPSAHDS